MKEFILQTPDGNEYFELYDYGITLRTSEIERANIFYSKEDAEIFNKNYLQNYYVVKEIGGKEMDGINDFIETAKRHNDINDNIIREKKEMVNHPEHYNGDSVYECVKVLKAWMSEDEYKGFLKGNSLKYLCRVGKKDSDLQELKKAEWYLQKLIEEYENDVQ